MKWCRVAHKALRFSKALLRETGTTAESNGTARMFCYPGLPFHVTTLSHAGRTQGSLLNCGAKGDWMNAPPRGFVISGPFPLGAVALFLHPSDVDVSGDITHLPTHTQIHMHTAV